MKRSNTVLAFLGILSMSLSSTAVFAKGDCRADREKFCSSVEKGGGRILACLKDHESELSSDCRGDLKEMDKKKAERREARQACREDRKKICGEVKPGEGRIKACLKEHESELSKDCRKAMDF